MRATAGKSAGRKRRNAMREAIVKRKLMSLPPGCSVLPSVPLFSHPLETIAFMKCGTDNKGDLLRTEAEVS